MQRWQGEMRVDAIAGRTTAVQAAAGVNAVAGLYLRLGALAGAGVRNAPGGWRRSGRLDLFARFQLDPLLQFRYGLYVGAGGSLFVDDGERRRARTVVLLGIEGPPTGKRWIFGTELGLGGGARIGVTIRRARKQAR